LKLFIEGFLDKLFRDVLALNRKDCRLTTGLLTDHCTLWRHPNVIRLRKRRVREMWTGIYAYFVNAHLRICKVRAGRYEKVLRGVVLALALSSGLCERPEQDQGCTVNQQLSECLGPLKPLHKISTVVEILLNICFVYILLKPLKFYENELVSYMIAFYLFILSLIIENSGHVS
jgi:hypothetical protein